MCKVGLTLSVKEQSKAGKDNGRRRPKIIVVGLATATLSAGTSATVTVSLNRAGQLLRERYGTLHVRLVVTGTDPSGNMVNIATRTVALKAPSKKPKHR
jgi:hypothetical protein